MRKLNRFVSLGIAAAITFCMIGKCVPMTASAETIPMTWKPMDKGYLVFEMDNGKVAMEEFYKIIVEEYGFPMVVSTVSRDLDYSAAKVARLRMLEDHGGEITSHTHNGLGITGRFAPAATKSDDRSAPADTSVAGDVDTDKSAKKLGALPFIILGACATVAFAVAGVLIRSKKEKPSTK